RRPERVEGYQGDREGTGFRSAAEPQLSRSSGMEGGARFSASPQHQRAAGTVPAQPPLPRAAGARRLGLGVLGAGLAALPAIGIYRMVEGLRDTRPHAQDEPDYVAAARRLNGASAILSLSMLTDSAMEHLRGAYHNPAMFLAPTVSAASLANSIDMTLRP